MLIKGIFHIHSNFSYDSEFTLSEIKKALLERGCKFGIICDHVQEFDSLKYDRMKEECRTQSGTDYIFIPGLEFEFDSIHVLGVDLKEYFQADNIEECLGEIKKQWGLAIWAHPNIRDWGVMEEHAESIDGIEVWSARYGTKYAPSIQLCGRLVDLCRRGREMYGYAGQDAHRKEQIKKLYIEMETKNIDREEILDNLSTGKFRMRFHAFSIPSSADLSWWQKITFPIIYNGYQFTEKIIDGLKGKGDRNQKSE